MRLFTVTIYYIFPQLVKEQKVRITELTKSKQEALSQQKVYVLAEIFLW